MHRDRKSQSINTLQQTINAGKTRTAAQLGKSIQSESSVAAALFEIINSRSPCSHGDPGTPTLTAERLSDKPATSHSPDLALLPANIGTDPKRSQGAWKRQLFEVPEGTNSEHHSIAAAGHRLSAQTSITYVDHQTRPLDDELPSKKRSMAESVDTLLRSFNPIPLIYQVAPVRVLETDRTSDNVQSIPESNARPSLFLLPLYFVEIAHWTLVVIRGQERDHCDFFDTRGPLPGAESSEALVGLLEERGFLRAG